MNYIYDILVDFNAVLYDFFEWDKDDQITHIRKIPLIKVLPEVSSHIVNNHVIISKEHLEKIYNKTEFFEKNRISTIPYALIIASEKSVVALKINKNGNIIEYSNLLIEEELDILEYIKNVDYTPFFYEILKPINREFKTKEEMKIKRYFQKEIKRLIEDHDDEKLIYIYLECFNCYKEIDEVSKTIFKEIENNWDVVYNKLYKLLKLNAIR